MEKCYEYFECKKMKCIRRKINDKQCWEIEDTRCEVQNEFILILRKANGSKIEACKLCLYYQYYNTE